MGKGERWWFSFKPGHDNNYWSVWAKLGKSFLPRDVIILHETEVISSSVDVWTPDVLPRTRGWRPNACSQHIVSGKLEIARRHDAFRRTTGPTGDCSRVIITILPQATKVLYRKAFRRFQ